MGAGLPLDTSPEQSPPTLIDNEMEDGSVATARSRVEEHLNRSPDEAYDDYWRALCTVESVFRLSEHEFVLQDWDNTEEMLKVRATN